MSHHPLSPHLAQPVSTAACLLPPACPADHACPDAPRSSSASSQRQPLRDAHLHGRLRCLLTVRGSV
eukprot:scaffold18403_cov48-Phaeocystis_antarctica.AAC.4